MVKIGGAVFATPETRPLLALRPRISQQVDIAALHQLEAGAGQTDGAVAQLVRLPGGTGRNACTPEQALRNYAIALASQAAVECAESEAKPVTSLPCQPLWRTAVWPPNDDAPQPQRGVGARGEVRVEWDDGRDWRRHACVANEHDGQSAMMLVDEPIVAIGRAAFKRRPDRAYVAGICERLRGRRNENGAGIEMRQPDDWRSIRPQIRIDRETGVPSAKSPARKILPDQQRRRRQLESRAGSRDCAAGTPKPARQV